MDTIQQLFIRLRSFVNSSDLTDSPTARELYQEFLNVNNETAQRLVKCGTLLQRKQKIEAVLLAQQDCNVFELIEYLQFQERQTLIILADLYGWAIPDNLPGELVDELKKAVSAMDDLRPLLTEFRRIARTDQVKNKLFLLREISRIDQGNPEWHQSLVDVENQYLSMLISEAKAMIEAENYKRLQEIRDELFADNWSVTIPTVVCKKVNKLVSEYNDRLHQEKANIILEKIRISYGKDDLVALGDAILLWDEHCNQNNYHASPDISQEIEHIREHLNTELENQQRFSEFQLVQEYIWHLMSELSPVQIIEEKYSEVSSFGYEVPDELTEAVKKYYRKAQLKFFAKKLSIIGGASLAILAVVAIAISSLLYYSQNKDIRHLTKLLNSGDIEKAKAQYWELNVKNIKFFSESTLVGLKKQIEDLEEKEKQRKAKFQALLDKIEKQKKQWPPSAELKEKAEELAKLAQSSEEKKMSKDVTAWLEEKLNKYAQNNQDELERQIAAISNLREHITKKINNYELDSVPNDISTLEKAIRKVKEIPVSQDKLIAYDELLNSPDALRFRLQDIKAIKTQLDEQKKQIAATSDISALKRALEKYKRMLNKDSAPMYINFYNEMQRDVTALETIFLYQSKRLSDTSSQQCLLFRDIEKQKERRNTLGKAKEKLEGRFDNLKKISQKKVYFFRFAHGTSYTDIFFPSSGSYAGDNMLVLKNIKDEEVSITQHANNVYQVKIKNQIYNNCVLVYPSKGSLDHKDWKLASHQLQIKRVSDKLAATESVDITAAGIKFLREIISDPFCANYWKMQLSLRICESLSALDQSPEKPLSALQAELEKIKKNNIVTGEPLADDFLNEKLDGFFRNYDCSQLLKAESYNSCYYRLYETAATRHFKYLGAVMNIDGTPIHSMAAEMKKKTGDIWCFDKQNKACYIIGYFDKGIYHFDEAFKDLTDNRVLFTTDPASNLLKETQMINQITEGNIIWPEFWPQNMKGDR